jgi:hypothetical protein
LIWSGSASEIKLRAKRAQHTAISPVRAQDLARIHWQTPVTANQLTQAIVLTAGLGVARRR